MKKKFDRKFDYINKRFPEFFRNNFEAERDQIYKSLITQIQDSELKGDYQSFFTTIGPIVEKINKVYGLSVDQREFLAAIFYRLAFEEENIFSLERIVFLSNLPAVERGGSRLRYFQLNWKAFYEFLQRFYLSNERISFISSHQSLAQYNSIVKIVRRNRSFFNDDNIFELLEIYREKGHPYDKFTGLLYFHLFSKFSKNTSPQAYEKVIEEFIRNANYLDPIYLDLFARILRLHKSLNWEKYYLDLFSIFLNFVEFLLPTTDKSRSNIFLNSTSLYSHLQLKAPIVSIPEIMVLLFVPETNPNHQKIWNFCERLFSLMDDFIHPQDDSKWTSQILCFYSIFISKYISRYRIEKKSIERHENLLKKKEDLKKNAANFPEEDHEEEVVLEPELEEEEKIRANEDEDVEDHYKDAELDEENDDESENDEENNENFESPTGKEEQKTQEKTDIPVKEVHDRAFFLDEACHSRFMDLVRPILKYLVFLRETKEGSIINICLKLCYFRPYDVIPILLKTIFSAFENPEMTFSTIYKILLIIIKPLLSREIYKPGLYELINILRKTNENIMASNWRQTYLVIKLYHRIFSLVPLYDVEDLKERYLKFHPESNEEELKVLLNKDEDIDIWQFTDELSDLALEYFKKILSILDFIEKPKNKEERSLRTLFINQHNKFWSFFFQSSPRLFNKYLYMIAEVLEDRIEIKAQEYYAFFLNACSLKDPKKSLDLFLPILFSKLMKKRKTPYNLEDFNKSPMFFLLKESPIQSKILEYEKEVLNKDIKLWYLNLLEDTISFGREFIVLHNNTLEIILTHYFLDEEIVIFEKICNILQKIILSLTAIYPLDLSCWNKSEASQEEFVIFFYKRIGQEKSVNFEVDWHESSPEERKLAENWVQRTIPRIIQHFEQQYFSQESFKIHDFGENFGKLVDQINLEIKEPSQSLRNEVWRMFIVLDQVLGGINMRCPQDCDEKLEENEVYLKFRKGFLFEEYYQLNEQILEFCKKCFSFFLDCGLINDFQIMLLFLKVVANLIGEDQYNSKMLSLKKWIKTELRIYRNPLEPNQGDIRLIKILSCTVALYTRIYSYSFILKLSAKYNFLQDILLITSFHPYERISGKSSPDLLDRVTVCSANCKQDTKKMLGKILNFIGDRLDIDSPLSLTRKYEKEQEKTSVHAYLSIIIQAFDRIIMNIYEIKTNSEFLKPILRIFCCYQYIEHQALQNKLFEIFLLKFFYLFENIITHPVYNVNHRLNQPILLKTNKTFKDYLQILQKNEAPQKFRKEELQQSLSIFQECLQVAIAKLSDEKTHWKQKIIYGLVSVSLSTILDPFCKDFRELMLSFMACLNSDHQFLRQMARPGLLKLYRLMKRLCIHEKIAKKIDKNDFQNQKKTIEELLNTRFLRKQDLEGCFIKDNFLGSFEYYSEIDVRNQWKDFKEPHFFDNFQEKAFCVKIIEDLAVDIGILQDNSGQNLRSGGLGVLTSRFISEIQSFMNSFFNKNKKKANNLKQIEIPYEIYVRFLQKLFQFYGRVFYENTIDLIISYAQEPNLREKQITISCYINALLKTIHIWCKDPSEQQKTLDFLCERLIFASLENSSLENYQTWIYNLYNVCYYRDFREIEAFFTKILEYLWAKGQQNPMKMQRYISLARLLCSNYGSRARDFSQKTLRRILIENEPTDLKQVAESLMFLADVSRWCFLVPINYRKIKEDRWVEGIETIIQDNSKFFLDDSEVLFEKNAVLTEVFQVLQKKALSNQGNYKNYLHLVSGLPNKILKKRINLMVFQLMEPFIVYNFGFKEEDINDQSVLKALNENIPYLARLRYAGDVLPQVFEVFVKHLGHEFWRIRLRALTFYHHFIFNNFFFLSFDKLMAPLLPSLLDENPSVSSLAMKILSDLLKLASKSEIQAYISQFTSKVKNNVEVSLDKEQALREKTLGIYSLMCLLLAFPNEIYSWTEQVLALVLQNKKLTKNSQAKIKEFCSKFWKNRSVYSKLSEIQLSEEMMVTLTEIANPYNYFA